MPTNAVSVAATGLPTRRLTLATLAGAGAALALLKPAHASTLADAVVFAQVAEYKRLRDLRFQADAHFDALCARIEAVVGPRPELSSAQVAIAKIRAMQAAPDSVHGTVDVLKFCHEVFATATEIYVDARKDWDERTQAARAKYRHHVADRRLERFHVREDRALDALTALRPVTLAGIIAKASAFEQSDNVSPGDHTDLAASVLRDLSAMGATVGGAA